MIAVAVELVCESKACGARVATTATESEYQLEPVLPKGWSERFCPACRERRRQRHRDKLAAWAKACLPGWTWSAEDRHWRHGAAEVWWSDPQRGFFWWLPSGASGYVATPEDGMRRADAALKARSC